MQTLVDYAVCRLTSASLPDRRSVPGRENLAKREPKPNYNNPLDAGSPTIIAACSNRHESLTRYVDTNAL
jgi:hypothetical protein